VFTFLSFRLVEAFLSDQNEQRADRWPALKQLKVIQIKIKY
jgi:hypothetical protein